MPSYTVRYGADSVNISFGREVSAREIKNEPRAKSGLGYGDNVSVLVGGVEQADTTIIRSGSTVTIETKANSKAATYQVVVRYGADSITKHYEEPVSIEDVVNDPAVRSALGFGDNIAALIGGVEQSLDTEILRNTTLTVETKANSKA